MKIATRLTILLIVLTFMVALIVGWFAVDASTRSLYSSLDQQINAVIASGAGHPDAALSDALNVVQENSYDLTLDVVDPSGAVVQVNAPATDALKKRPTLADVHATLAGVDVQPNLPGFRMRSINVGGGDFLVVAGSTSAISAQGRRLALDVALIGFLVALVMLVLARLVMRKDLRTMGHLIGYASEVARGEERGAIPPSAGSRDVRELQSALATMVVALHERIAIEERSVEAMQQFVGDASHELRTPLTVIKGYNELLTNPSINDEQRARAVERVRREVDRMDLLVADLLLSAEVREAPQHLNTRVELSTLVATRVEEFRNDHPERAVSSDLAIGLAVTGREDLLDRLLVNSLSNIVRHTAKDTEVRVTLRREGTRAVLVVEDAGRRPARLRRAAPAFPSLRPVAFARDRRLGSRHEHHGRHRRGARRLDDHVEERARWTRLDLLLRTRRVTSDLVGRGSAGRAHVELLDLGQGVAIERDVFAESFPAGLEHGRDGVDDELGAREVRRRRRELQGRQLQEDEEVVAEHGLDRRRTQVRDLVGLVDGLFARITHGNNVVPRARASASEGRCDQVC